MSDELAVLFDAAKSGVWIFAAVFLRVGAAMALLPAFGEQAVPARVKLGITLAFTMIVATVIWEEVAAHLNQVSWISLIASEVVAGLAIGLVFRLFVIALQIAGAIAGQSTSLSQIFGAGVGVEPQPAFSTLFVMAGLCLAVMAGLHVRVAEALIFSYEIFTLGDLPFKGDLTPWGIEKISFAFSLGFGLAAPFVLASVVYNFGLGVINRAMPQLMVAFVGAPAISMGGLVLLLIMSPVLLSVWLEAFVQGTNLKSAAF